MRVLITGALGFVGRHLAALCAARGATVIGSGRDPASADERAAGLHKYLAADLAHAPQARDAVAAAAPHRVFHLAASASVAASWDDQRATLANNLWSTANVLDAVAESAPGARVLVACSGEEYGPVPPDHLPVTESEPLRPQNPYAVSKASVDLLAGFYADARGLAVVRTRAFNHAGPGQSPAYVASDFARQIAEAEAAGEPGPFELRTGDLSVRRDFTDVRDVVRAYWLALERGEPGEVYNVCSGESVAVADILAGLSRHSPLEVEAQTDPRRLRPHEVMEIRGSHDKLTQATGWRPEVPLERTLGDTLDWWRAQLAAEPAA